ncbi:MAG: DUF4118 domain-containing protein [Alicyclobacillus sp.]|nr:DUF4118 domain-containing protein [Alicyclobacillus sp.]
MLKWRVLTSYMMPWPNPGKLPEESSRRSGRFPYLVITLMVALLTTVFWKVGNAFNLVNLALLYLLPVLVSAARWGRGPSFYAAGIGVVSFDFFFVPPVHRFSVADIRYLVSFIVYLAVAAFTASLAAQLRQNAREAIAREAVTSSLFTLSTQVAAGRDLDQVLREIVVHAWNTFGLPTAILLPHPNGELQVQVMAGFPDGKLTPALEPRVIEWVYKHGQMAGYGSSAHRDGNFLYVPLKTESKVHGVMCVGADHRRTGTSKSARIPVVQALAGLASVSIARTHFEEEAKIAHLTAESERLRTALLDSISHELRTPLATIIGAATALGEGASVLSADDQHELLLTVHEGAMRMNRLVTNLLGMVRLESGMLRLNKKWCDVSDMIGVALSQVHDALQNRKVSVHLPSGLPPVAVDDVLVEQALVNLLSNAIKYSPDGSAIDIDALEYDGVLTLRIRDRGIGIPEDEADKIFDKFYRSQSAQAIPGTGLGLAICKGIIQAHGGEIYARPADDTGTVFTIRLPVGDSEQQGLSLGDTEEMSF